MHIAVSWDISASGERWTEIDNQLKAPLTQYSWVKPLETFYIIKIGSEAERKNIKDALVQVATEVAETVHFLVTPAMIGGKYDGYLPKDTWPLINKRTIDD